MANLKKKNSGYTRKKFQKESIYSQKIKKCLKYFYYSINYSIKKQK